MQVMLSRNVCEEMLMMKMINLEVTSSVVMIIFVFSVSYFIFLHGRSEYVAPPKETLRRIRQGL